MKSILLFVSLLLVINSSTTSALTCFSKTLDKQQTCAKETLQPQEGGKIIPLCYSFMDCDTLPSTCILEMGTIYNTTYDILLNEPNIYRNLQGCYEDFCLACPTPSPTFDNNTMKPILFTGITNLNQNSLNQNDIVVGTIVGIINGVVALSVFASIFFE
jgi:hypothetical protein